MRRRVGNAQVYLEPIPMSARFVEIFQRSRGSCCGVSCVNRDSVGRIIHVVAVEFFFVRSLLGEERPRRLEGAGIKIKEKI